IRSQETQLVGLNVGRALGLVLPSSFGLVAGALRQDDVIRIDARFGQLLRIRLHLAVAGDGIRARETGDDVGIAALEIPEVMQVAVRQDHEPAILGTCVTAGLFLADQRVLILRLGLEHDQRETALVQQQKIDEALAGPLEVVAERVEVGLLYGRVGFKPYVGWTLSVVEEAPTSRLKQPVD